MAVDGGYSFVARFYGNGDVTYLQIERCVYGILRSVLKTKIAKECGLAKSPGPQSDSLPNLGKPPEKFRRNTHKKSNLV